MDDQNIISKSSYLSFKLDDEIFAISVKKVLEVLEMQKITKVPQTPDYIKGVINFRGEILPVIDTRVKFKMPDFENISKTVIIVLELTLKEKHVTLGAIADGVKDVLEIDTSQIRDVPELGTKYNTEFLKGMIKDEEESFIMLLDIEKVFTVEDLYLVQEATESTDQQNIE